jgi:hypothetical protein
MTAIGTTTLPDDHDTKGDPDYVLYFAAWLLDVVEADYKGCHLVLQPDAIGWAANDEYVVHAYQVGGQSPDGGPVERWWCFRVDDLWNIRLSDTEWHWVPPGGKTPCVETRADEPGIPVVYRHDEAEGGGAG